ncbi:hypothetical protein GVAV_003428 [Gurleya vavrai]
MPRFSLPKLNYDYSSLSNHIDQETMVLHHTKHHQAYIDNFNNELESSGLYKNMSLCEIIARIANDGNDTSNTIIKNNAGGHYNHSLFWLVMNPESNVNDICPELLEKINESFESLAKMQEIFNEAAKKVFGSGWAWLCYDKTTDKLVVKSSINQDNPFMFDKELFPFLALDVWEHAYYLKYQNKRFDYIKAWWNIVDWKNVSKFYINYAKKGVVIPIKDDGTLD